MMRRLTYFFLTFLCWTCYSQDSVNYSKDSIVLSLEKVLELSVRNHPIVKQAELQDRFATATLTGAKGFLDPKLKSSYSRKDFKDKTYYDRLYSALEIPIWFPIDPKIEVYQNQGEFLNPENYVGPNTDYWQMTAGLSLPIGKGLFIDERRSLIKQARLFSNIAEAEKIKLTNKTLITIVKAYWEWYFNFQKYLLMQQSIGIAEELYRRVKNDFTFGEASVVDTIQAKITLQNRVAEFQNSRIQLINARLGLSVHLWDEEERPLELPETAIPSDQEDWWLIPSDTTLSVLKDWSQKNHPEIRKLLAKRNQTEVEQQWNRESLKPEINLSYSFIDSPFNIDGFDSPEFGENYKFGLDFSFPLFLRKERGTLQKSKIYLESIDFELQQTKQQVIASISAIHQELVISETLSLQYGELANNYNKLLTAEIFNLQTGESDLFKLNIQQDKFIESKIKYLKALTLMKKLRAELPYRAGLPFLDYSNVYE